MENTKMPKSEVLTPDESLVADFIKTRTQESVALERRAKTRLQESLEK